jgi:hypothetical protein
MKTGNLEYLLEIGQLARYSLESSFPFGRYHREGTAPAELFPKEHSSD